ncbi:MAG: extracellular solute-binding protein [Erysipelotrichaceae bacterium]|jgi:arabinogalactan oligomer/maltooligosaccharide transport system substrate-binding protein|nr:extracellular solute-binding protein [Erysipelotrichaceae bacterium]
MSKTKILIPILGAAMLLVGCGGEKPGTEITLRISCPSEDRAVTDWIVQQYRVKNPNVKFEITEIREGDIAQTLLTDIDTAPDVFAIVDDNIRELANGSKLLRIPTDYVTRFTAANIASSVEAVKIGGRAYGFPQTADNGYFLFYNSSMINASEINSLETLLAKAKTLGKQVLFDYANSWYTPSIFFANGGSLSLDGEGAQVSNFNNANGVAAAEAFMELAKTYAGVLVPDSGDANVTAGLMNGNVCAAVTGTWNAPTVQGELGDNLKFAPLPSIKINGVDKPLGSFRGSKALSIKANIGNKLAQALDFAEFATGKEAQERRFNVRQIGPSNKEVAESPAVKANLMLAALSEQNARSVVFSQATTVSGNFWDPMAAVGTCFKNGTWGSGQTAKTILDAFIAQLTNPLS